MCAAPNSDFTVSGSNQSVTSNIEIGSQTKVGKNTLGESVTPLKGQLSSGKETPVTKSANTIQELAPKMQSPATSSLKPIEYVTLSSLGINPVKAFFLKIFGGLAQAIGKAINAREQLKLNETALTNVISNIKGKNFLAASKEYLKLDTVDRAKIDKQISNEDLKSLVGIMTGSKIAYLNNAVKVEDYFTAANLYYELPGIDTREKWAEGFIGGSKNSENSRAEVIDFTKSLITYSLSKSEKSVKKDGGEGVVVPGENGASEKPSEFLRSSKVGSTQFITRFQRSQLETFEKPFGEVIAKNQSSASHAEIASNIMKDCIGLLQKESVPDSLKDVYNHLHNEIQGKGGSGDTNVASLFCLQFLNPLVKKAYGDAPDGIKICAEIMKQSLKDPKMIADVLLGRPGVK